MAVDRAHPRTAVVWGVVSDALTRLASDGTSLHVLDLGGGTGGFAVPIAGLGHRVTVVDPSPDSLAALQRRAAEADVMTLIDGVQGDAAGVVALLGSASVDAVVCHSVLEVVDDPAAALRAVAEVLRPGGLASVLAANRVAAVLARVATGRLRDARQLLADDHGHAGPGDPLRRRFTLAELESAVLAAGLLPRDAHGIRIFTDLAPASISDADAAGIDDLMALEQAAAHDPAYTAVATMLHVLADRP